MSSSDSAPRYHDVPNDQLQGYAVFAAAFCALVIIRSIYWASDAPSMKQYKSPTNVAVLGLRALRVMATLLAAIDALLAFRILFPIHQGQFFTLNALTISWWCVIRILLASFTAITAYIFDTHASIRLFICSLTCIILLLALLSEQALVNQLYCYSQGLCASESDTYTLNNMVLRDLFEIIIAGTNMMTAFWLLPIFGVCSNILYLPPYEYRQLHLYLDGLNQNVIKRPKDSSVQKLQNMMGLQGFA